MIYPNFIKNNSIIHVVAPSDGAFSEIDKKRYILAKEKLESMSYQVKFSKSVFMSKKGRSNLKEIRAEELNNAFKDNSNLILCACGGEFLIEILPYVDFNLLTKNIKWVQGFSDPTSILYILTTKYDISTIYSSNLGNFAMEKYHNSQKDNLNILTGNLVKQYSYDMYCNNRLDRIIGNEYFNLDTKVKWEVLNNSYINISGRVIGGCLDVLMSLFKTKYDDTSNFIERYKKDGIIWYFDICDLTYEDMIRAMWTINEYGYFKYSKAILLGRFNNTYSYLNYDLKSAIIDSVLNELNIQVIYDVDISHKGPSMTIINGAIMHLEVKNHQGVISFDLK